MQSPRSEKSQAAYEAFKKAHDTEPERLEHFNLDDETIIKQYTYWAIIENRFPYDNMARTNHLLVSKRPIESHYHGTPEEQDEFHTIMQELADDGFYDARIENFPKVKSVKQYAHVHLIQWHNTQ